MNIQEIISEIKKLNEEEVIKFNTEFSKFYKPYKKKEAELKKIEKEKKEAEEYIKMKEAGDKICELYKVNGFPVSSVYKAYDAPYSTYEDEGTYVLTDANVADYFDDNNIDKPVKDELDKLFDIFFDNMSEKHCLDEKKDGDDLYPGDTIYNFYMKGGTFKKAMDNEIEDIITN